MTRFDGGLLGRAVVMTLDRRLRAGELGDAAEKFLDAGLPTRRFLVGDGQLYPAERYGWIDVEASPRRQAFNYASAFLKIIRDEEWVETEKPLLYLEDDAQLTTSAFELMPAAFAEFARVIGDDWDFFMLGGNHVNGRVYIAGEHIIRPTYSLDLHSVVINRRAFSKLLSIAPSAEHTIDGVIAEMQRIGNLIVYAINPPVAYQRPGWSHNENRYDDKTDRQLVRYS